MVGRTARGGRAGGGKADGGKARSGKARSGTAAGGTSAPVEEAKAHAVRHLAAQIREMHTEMSRLADGQATLQRALADVLSSVSPREGRSGTTTSSEVKSEAGSDPKHDCRTRP